MYGITDNGIVNGLGKPTIKFEFETNDELKRFLNDNKDSWIEPTIDVETITEDNEPQKGKGKKKSVQGKSKKSLNGSCLGKISADVFNVPESKLKCFGFVPTYVRLSDYSHLIDTAANESVLTGYGFDGATLNTLVNTVQKYRPQVAKLANHLKADTPEQSAFNVWHWLHTNVKYNYDTAGKEEIRTPARTWADRKRGVDCDCLSVFTACLLINMGYEPKFEIVAFANKPQYSHIFVNLDGIAIDRVLPSFNSRPPLITKTMYMDIPVFQLSGIEDTAISNALNGLYDSTLSKIAAGTATAKDKLNFRKTQVLVTLQGTDYNGFRLAGLLMPYVTGIDESGAYYFDNPEIAGIAAAGEDELVAAELRGADEIELGKLFKKIGKALKKAAKKVGNAVKTVAKSTAKVVKAAAKATKNAVKATANLTKASVQAVTGKGKKAKETLKKAAKQVKSSVVDPIKTTAKATKDIVKVTVVEPTKSAVKAAAKATKAIVKVAGKAFKVIFVKINPATVLMRNALRLLVGINFLGMATRLNVANMTKEQAIAAGYSAEQWESAKKSKKRVVNFFTKMGGKAKNIEKSIVNGAKKKALFKKDYKPTSQIVENGEDNAALSCADVPIMSGLDGLGAAISIGAALAAVGGFIGKIWKWIAKIVPKAVKAVAKVGKKAGKAVATVAKKTGKGVSTAAKKTASAVATAAKKTGKGVSTAAKKTASAVATAAKKTATAVKNTVKKAAEVVKKNKGAAAETEDIVENTQFQTANPNATKKKNNLLPVLIAAGALLTIGGVAYAATRKKRA